MLPCALYIMDITPINAGELPAGLWEEEEQKKLFQVAQKYADSLLSLFPCFLPAAESLVLDVAEEIGMV